MALPSSPAAYYFQLSHHDLVLDIQPPTFTHCFICIGRVEVNISPLALPFRSPTILHCKFKVEYAVPVEKPWLKVRDVFKDTYRVVPLKFQPSPAVPETPEVPSPQPPNSATILASLMAWNLAAQHAASGPPSVRPMHPLHSTPKRTASPADQADSRKRACCHCL